ncbi:MAG: hypothetical protein RIE73_02770 [Coleofasciculus sp. C1-SOL-03]|jgi:hypothetical protein|uniref:hypothetical protein n=1 Tax=Coleofasciculus sp. C1-SOL-03 TaxID=3069522 RepID=UPI0033053E1D
MQLFAVIINGHWQPGIGDPTFMGWFTVVAYFITAVLCLICALPHRFVLPLQRVSRNRWLWGFFAIILVVLGINKQLDLQSWLTVVGKELALSQGWYQQRRMVQVQFIVGIAIAALILLTVIGRAIYTERQTYRLALLGLMFLSCFIVIRASSFHHIDSLLGWQLLGLRMNWILEIGGIACIAIAAVRTIFKPWSTTKS